MRAEAGLVRGEIVAGQHTRMERWLRWQPIHEVSIEPSTIADVS